MEPRRLLSENGFVEGPHFDAEPLADEHAAWEEIDAGRFMPRRVRGSYQGRALG